MSPSLRIMYAVAFFSCLACVSSQKQPKPYDYPTANLSTLWINNAFNSNILETRPFRFDDGSTVRPILLKLMAREDDWPFDSSLAFACGFYCIGTCDSYLFAVYIVNILDQNDTHFQGTPQVVWSANRNHPVREDATIHLTARGDLVLRDADGTFVWSTNTAGKDVAGLKMMQMGNLVLFDANHSVIWQSFDHPTDCLLDRQILRPGKNLTAAASSTNWSAGLHFLSLTRTGLEAYVLSRPPQLYHGIPFSLPDLNQGSVEFRSGTLQFHENESDYLDLLPTNLTITQYIKLEFDGHLRVFRWSQTWAEEADFFGTDRVDCSYPMTCGRYGICSKGQCSCPDLRFRQIDKMLPDLGCAEVTPLTCNASDKHTLLDLNVTYFTFIPNIVNTDITTCKKTCLKNCSCKAAIFRYNSNSSSGDCYFPTEIFSLMNDENKFLHYNLSVSIKVQIAKSKTSLLWLILGPSLGVSLAVVIIGTTLFVCMRRKRETEDAEEDHLDHVPGMPTRFSFEELAAATDNFCNKLGEGGFGSVYEGSLNDGTRIAVKCLDGVGHIKKSFLAEVETIGSIHHVNLVKLVGFCAEKSHRLLVYEYMSNGSLDKWIYNGRNGATMEWYLRRKVILEIAKGLTYLHEDCRQKILHLDIKPQNILLDEHYSAKVADFGLAKLIDRNQSQVVATMRGTPGYLAPEWLSAVITEKVDVYSFGMVILEILTGRRIFEQSRPEEDQHLLAVFKWKLKEGNWLDLVDECCRNVEANVAEVEKLMRISAWCLQVGYEKRPSMSMVIKVLEGVREVPGDIDYERLIPQYLGGTIPEGSSHDQDLTPLLPSVLSRPR